MMSKTEKKEKNKQKLKFPKFFLCNLKWQLEIKGQLRLTLNKIAEVS